MKIRRRIEIEVQTEKFLVGGVLESNCAVCGGRARMLTVYEAASLSGVDSQAIDLLIGDGRLHFQLTTEGSLLICLASLYERLSEPEPK